MGVTALARWCAFLPWAAIRSPYPNGHRERIAGCIVRRTVSIGALSTGKMVKEDLNITCNIGTIAIWHKLMGMPDEIISPLRVSSFYGNTSFQEVIVLVESRIQIFIGGSARM
ncbi:hypothetical protein BDN71DRAFT_1458395 [Pleurotus eryngii]|uniref:Uncharacterized protein n=1 Tax=Pleurotus eryngii TaxID=5323 RepID=A0A9P6D0G8_PLEER|nr:hypothetical protein BDN71DRAFT_1458395 [Pleurotus eryngii]